MAEQSHFERENRCDQSKPEDEDKLQMGASAGNFALRRAHYFEGGSWPAIECKTATDSASQTVSSSGADHL